MGWTIEESGFDTQQYATDIPMFTVSRSGSWAHTTRTMSSFPGVKRPRRDADDDNAYSYTFTSHATDGRNLSSTSLR
jgi:hypothetical protein